MRRRNIKLKNAIDRIFSHNSIIAIWEDNGNYDTLLWKGMAWDLPNEYYRCRKWIIFGTVPESIDNADTINIRIWG